MRRERAMGVERNWRVECRFLIAESRLEGSVGSSAGMVYWYILGVDGQVNYLYGISDRLKCSLFATRRR